MQRFRYEWVVGRDLSRINRLLSQGWKPARETVVAQTPAGSPSGELFVVLERDDAFPSYQGAHLCEGVPAEFFDDIPLFAGLGEDHLREVISACEVARYDADTVIFDGSTNEHRLYVVLEGAVSIQLMGLPIDDPIVLEASSKDVFGESTFFAAGAHSTCATATAATRTLELTRARYEDLLQGQRTSALLLAVNAASILGHRLQTTDQWIREILQGEQTSDVVRSWRRFRRGIHGGGAGSSGSFFGV